VSDTERLNLRDLPPVEPVDPPERLSQTLARLFDRCKRSAYLYMKHGGGTPSHDLDRGTAAHMFAERLMRTLIEQEEPSLYAPAEGEDPVSAARQVASMTAAMVDEIAAEHPELTLPAFEWDAVRQMAYHLAVGLDVDPRNVVGIEQKFVLDLECGLTLSGKIDLASIDGDFGGVDDYKSSFHVPPQGDFEKSIQVKLYAVLLMFGQPVTKRWINGLVDPASLRVTPGAVVPVSGEVEERHPPLGDGLQFVRGRELYLRYLTDDLRLRERYSVFSRQQLVDFRLNDLERIGRDLSAALESWKFPAVPGSHCSECPCEPECPLPADLRRHAGEINSEEQAVEALAWAERTSDRVNATRKEVRNFAKSHGPLRVGDLIFEWRPESSWVTDWPGLEEHVVECAVFGKPLDLPAFRKERVSTKFAKRRLTAEELGEADEVSGDVDVEAERDAKYGVEAPW
jgi:hypothetical protein